MLNIRINQLASPQVLNVVLAEIRVRTTAMQMLVLQMTTDIPLPVRRFVILQLVNVLKHVLYINPHVQLGVGGEIVKTAGKYVYVIKMINSVRYGRAARIQTVLLANQGLVSRPSRPRPRSFLKTRRSKVGGLESRPARVALCWEKR